MASILPRAGNRRSFSRELAELALAHLIGNKAEQLYRRDDALERRRLLMEAWAAFCEPILNPDEAPEVRRS